MIFKALVNLGLSQLVQETPFAWWRGPGRVVGSGDPLDVGNAVCDKR